MGSRAKPTREPGRGRRCAAVTALRPACWAAALTLLAAPYVGMVWERVAPAPTYINISGQVFLDNQDTSEFIAADGWFLIIGVLVGVLGAGLGYWRYRSNLGVILAMTAASVLGALIAREVGEAFGPVPIEVSALSLPAGETVRGQIELASDGVLFGWGVGILLTYLSLIGGLERSRPDPESEAAWAQPGWGGFAGEPNGRAESSVRGGGLGGEVDAGQRGQGPKHDAFTAEQREFGP